jgi:GAF domain-containing protein
MVAARAEVLTAVGLGKQIAEEQAALRRVATLVARPAPPAEVFAAVTAEVGRLLDVDFTVLIRSDPDDTITVVGTWTSTGAAAPSPVGRRFQLGGRNVSTLVLTTGRPARLDAYADVTGAIGSTGARDWRFRSSVGVPISVEGRLWGLILVAYTRDQPLPEDTEGRLAGFTELVAAAIANAQARVELRGFAEEQAALRRVATLVARATPPEEVFAAVTAEVGRVLDSDVTILSRYDPEDMATILAAWSSAGTTAPTPAGTRFELGGRNVHTLVFETRRPARTVRAAASGRAADVFRLWGIRAAVGAPISVEGRLWGVMVAIFTSEQPLPAATETRLARFTELVATAIANSQARVELRGYAEEQAALRRVATLVARATVPAEVFAAVTAEVGRLLEVDFTHLCRYDPDGAATTAGVWNPAGGAEPVPGETRWGLGGWNVTTLVFRTGRPARIDDYDHASGAGASVGREWGFRSAVGVPISVEGRLWGFMLVAYTHEERLPADTEARLAGFAELVATAIANAEGHAQLENSRDRLRRLADEQAALRRIATLVARGVPPAEVFAAVAHEVGHVLDADGTVIVRLDPDTTTTLVASVGTHLAELPVGSRWKPEPPVAVAVALRTCRPARCDNYNHAPGDYADAVRRLGLRSSVAAPITVEGRLWGAIGAGTRHGRFPTDTEHRMAGFTELIATAIANADSRAQLTTSRARIVTAADDARRRIERDLHDSTQQRLVALGLTLRLARTTVPADLPQLQSQLSRITDELTEATEELREIARGIHPAILSEGGLGPALRTLARRAAIPVELAIHTHTRPPDPVEVAAYYVVSEALTNTTKHAHASHAHIAIEQHPTHLHLSIHDDGIGGADPAHGSGLTGLRDRVHALDGTINVDSRPGHGTTILVELPLQPD